MMNKLYIYLLSSILIVFLLASCGSPPKKLPILGKKYEENGDTVYHTIPEFSFINQDSVVITNKTYEDKIYVVDFFFTSCPTICPIVKAQMLRIQDRFKNEDRLMLLSHSIDTRRDSVPRLKEYASKIGLDSSKWSLVTGDKKEIYGIAEDYFSVAIEDESAPGGYDHSGRLILIDQQGHIRSFCDGTSPEDVDKFMNDIEYLLNEMDN